MDASQSVNAGARLDRLPISRLHWRILGLITAGATLDAFDIYLAGGVVAAMLKEGFATTQQSAVFISTTFFGMLIGAGFAGYLGDRMGRRYSYQFNLAVFGVASLAACFAPDIKTLTVLRFIMGIGMGAELVVAAGTLCEFVPPTYRGRWISMLGIVTNAGLLLASSDRFRRHSQFWLALYVRHRRCWRPHRLGPAQKDARKPAMARSGRPPRRSRGDLAAPSSAKKSARAANYPPPAVVRRQVRSSRAPFAALCSGRA